MTEQRDTTDMLHGIVAELDRGDGRNFDWAPVATEVRDVTTVVDTLDQRLKGMGEEGHPKADPITCRLVTVGSGDDLFDHGGGDPFDERGVRRADTYPDRRWGQVVTACGPPSRQSAPW